MTLKIAQDFEYAGSDYWHWRAWIAGPEIELAKVGSVKWLLHPSFTPSIVESTDRLSGFRLDSSGWGTFVLKADVQLTDGSVIKLARMLELAYPDTEPEAPTKEGEPPVTSDATAQQKGVQRKIFLSYGAEDRKRAISLRHTLESIGLQVVDGSYIIPGEPWELAIRDLQAGADATIAYVSSGTPSQFVAREINASILADKPTLVITSDDIEGILGVDSPVPLTRVDTEDASGILRELKTLKLVSDSG